MSLTKIGPTEIWFFQEGGQKMCMNICTKYKNICISFNALNEFKACFKRYRKESNDETSTAPVACWFLRARGGSLLHRVPWKADDSFKVIAESYADFTVRHYDGYSDRSSIKENSLSETGRKFHPIVSFIEEIFLSKKRILHRGTKTNPKPLISLVMH